MRRPTPEPKPQPYAEARDQAQRLWFIAGAAALAYGVSLRDAPYPDQAAAKVLMCALLVLAAARHTPMRERRWLCAALTACAIGDALLALPQLPLSFIGGLAAFGLAHLAYSALLWPLASPWRAVTGWRRAALPLLWLVALALYAWFFPHLGDLALPVAAYMAALCLMASLAVAARLPSAVAAFGGLAFVASDTMIGIERFIGPFAGSAYAIWASYAVAQLALSRGILLSRQR
ncbi:lysoplasmalogenase [Trinickia sp. LjRoot230]|uniref:lysoplasmalogenase n=1 Tax=Trinickia sp. LjRoot230 TaxID=3342288 RepID=UPI003ECC7004